VSIDLDAIEHNARSIAGLCARHGMELIGVTKGTCGHPEVARAMLAGGVAAIGESRLENIRRLRAAGVPAPFWLLRIPPLSEADEVVALADVSLNSELAVLERLSRAALRRGQAHEVVLMVDLGDLREGIWPDDLPGFARSAAALAGVRIVGLGTNLTCFGGIAPSGDNMRRLVAHARDIERTLGLGLRFVSGANSSGLELIAAGGMPREVNHARIGEAILLGRETLHRKPWPGTRQDAFQLRAEVLEVKEKPSLPGGERAEDAFGRVPAPEAPGMRVRAIVNVGREDIAPEGIAPLDSRLKVLGASSDYLVLDATAAAGALRVGDELAFSLNYAALLAAMTSQYVEKRCARAGTLAGSAQ
jgi:predicted amino acid racemase